MRTCSPGAMAAYSQLYLASNTPNAGTTGELPSSHPCVERGPHGVACVVESRTDDPRWDAQLVRDGVQGIPLVVREQEDRALVGGQSPEPTLEFVPIGERQHVVRSSGLVDRENPEVGRSAPLARGMIDAFVDDEAMEPRVEPVRIAEPAQITPGDHQRVLQGILGPIDVTKNPMRQREQAIHARTNQVDERRLVPALGRLDELAVHLFALSASVGNAFR
jgi:hypothetical protein